MNLKQKERKLKNFKRERKKRKIMISQEEKTNQILEELEKKYPFFDFSFKDIPEMTVESMKKTRNRMFGFGIVVSCLIILLIGLTIHSLITYEEDEKKTFIENFGYCYYYLLSISYYIPLSFILLFLMNVSWDYFKYN